MKLRIWVCAAFVMAAAAGGRAQVTQVLPTVVASTSEFNPWIVGLGLACAVLLVLVILARNGKLGGASAGVTGAASAVATAAKADSESLVTRLELAVGKLAQHAATTGASASTVAAATTAPKASVSSQVPPKRNPAPSAAVAVPAPSTGGFAIPQHLVGN